MKKTLIALAALGMVAGAAQAGNVTVYGKLQPSYDFMKVTESNGDSSTITNMNNNASAIGFKGSEDLGNGLKAIFKLETEFDLVDDGALSGSGAARDTWVGLQGDFGTVTFGNRDSAYKKITAGYDKFSFTIGDYNSLMGMADSGAEHANKRWTKSLNYLSPSFNGLKVTANYATNDYDINAMEDGVTKSWGLGVNYDNGPLNVLAAYEKQEDAAKFLKVGAKYNVDAFTVKGIYEKADIDGAGDQSNIFLGVDFKVDGNTSLMADYISAGDANDNDDTGAYAWNLGVKYKLSKRTSVIGVYSYLKNDSDAAYGNDSGYSGAETHNPWWAAEHKHGTEGFKVTGVSVRLQHKF